MKVLVVDDSQLTLMMVEGELKASRLVDDIILCSDSSGVMAILDTQNVDIVFMDIIMPGLTGLDVLRQIRERTEFNDVQVIMLTSSDKTNYFRESFNIGADDFLKKPVDPMELQARLKAAMKTRRNLLLMHEMNQSLMAKNDELVALNNLLKETQFSIIQQEKLASIGELAAGIAHEINNPIGFVGSNIEVLRKYVKKIVDVLEAYRQEMRMLERHAPEACLESVRQAMENARSAEKAAKLEYTIDEIEPLLSDSLEGIGRVAKIVQTLRSFARTGLDEENAICSVNEIVQEALLILKNEYKYTIDIESDMEENAEIQCNRGQIEQVFINILMNAIQAIKSMNREERGHILIRTRRAGPMLTIEIADNGPGIPDQVLGKIFDPFFTTKDVGEGTGLGLSISHYIIANKHKGSIAAYNNPAGGACFTIELPVSRGQ